MTPERFTDHHKRLGMSRAAFARALGINKGTALAYARGVRPVPLTVRLAIAALLNGLKPAE